MIDEEMSLLPSRPNRRLAREILLRAILINLRRSPGYSIHSNRPTCRGVLPSFAFSLAREYEEYHHLERIPRVNLLALATSALEATTQTALWKRAVSVPSPISHPLDDPRPSRSSLSLYTSWREGFSRIVKCLFILFHLLILSGEVTDSKRQICPLN